MPRLIEISYPAKMRYATVGDYFIKPNGTLRFEILDTGNEFTNRLVLIHELVEETLLEMAGISIDEIDAYDKAHEDDPGQPGDMVDSPYKHQHGVAIAVERMMCAVAGVAWVDHEGRVAKTYDEVFGKPQMEIA
jgi:hypothetical protein